MNWSIQLIPSDPFFRPSEEAAQAALNRLLSYFTHHEGIEYTPTDKLAFYCAGENFDKVICANCRRDIFDWFISFVPNQEFKTTRDLMVTLPCCSAEGSLLDLTFEDPGGFAFFGLSICEGYNDDADTNDLSEMELHQLETILGCKLRVIWSGH